MNIPNGIIRSAGIALLLATSVAGCNVQLKTITLQPIQTLQGIGGGGGASGYCTGSDDPNKDELSGGPGQFIVGFDDWFRAGAPPFPCDVYRSFVYRAGVKFDLSQFKSIVGANLTFDAASSMSRSNGQPAAQMPAFSFATTLGLAHNALGSDNDLDDDDEASLVQASGSTNVGVSGQVREWLSGAHVNNGFVIGGPLAVPNNNDMPRDNDSQVSWYQNFQLQVTYNPAQNPGAPQ